MKIRERNEVRSFEKLRRHQSTGRILNMIDYTNASRKRVLGQSLSADGSPHRRLGLFKTPILNNVIFAKHNLRPNEREMFPSGVRIATKIFIPFDAKRLECGGRSFFIEEPNFAGHLRDVFNIDAESADPSIVSDMRILDVLARTPTLDPFVLCERLRSAGIQADPELFSGSYALMRNESQRVLEVFQPLLAKALNKTASPAEMARFAEQIWNVTENTTSSPFLEALQIPRPEWVSVIFGWKALIYYQISFQNADNCLGDVILRLRKIRVSDGTDPSDQSNLREAGHIFLERLRRLRDATKRSIERSMDRLLNAVSENSDPLELALALREMAVNVSGVGANVMLFDQVTSYFLYLFPSNGGLVSYQVLCEAIDNLSEILALASSAENSGSGTQLAFA